MNAVESMLQHLVDAGFPGGFVFVQDADGSEQFITAGVADLRAGGG